MERCEMCNSEVKKGGLENILDLYKACKKCADEIKAKNSNLKEMLKEVKNFHGFCKKCKKLLGDNEGWDRMLPLCQRCFEDFAGYFKGTRPRPS
ncbi:MAG: hypothetical protein QW390_02090 [Candidatus Bathyarchaeia archaeon]